MATKFASGLRENLSSKGETQVRLILRIQGDPANARKAAEKAGLRILRTFRLFSGFAVSGPASAILSLANASWLARIEPDRPVRKQRKP